MPPLPPIPWDPGTKAGTALATAWDTPAWAGTVGKGSAMVGQEAENPISQSVGGSRASTAYGAGRLSALPAQFPVGGSPAGGVGASPSLSPYAAAAGAGGARKSVTVGDSSLA
jgi:hypothetical protein